MNFGKIVQDPYYTRIIFHIESIIHGLDEAAKGDGIEIKDSEVKSVLQKVIGILKGKRPNISEKNEKEAKLKLMFSELVALFEHLKTEIDDESIPKSDWIISLRVVDDSLKTRREMYGHSRGYLDFLKGFFRDNDLL